MVKVGMISKWHVHADDYAKQVKNNSKASLVAVYDEDKERGMAWAKELDVKFFECLDDMLENAGIDAVVIDAPTTMHEEIMIKCAAAGKHIFTEKSLTTTRESAKKIETAIKNSKIKFCISFPAKTSGYAQFALEKIKEGAFGNITEFRHRNAHNGLSANWLPSYWMDKKQAGGGALMDLGCHSVYLALEMLGAPSKVSACMTNSICGGEDETTLCTLEYSGKTIALIETSLVSPGSAHMFEIYGDKASFVVYNDSAMFADESTDFVPTAVTLPAQKALPLSQFIDSIEDNTQLCDMFSIEKAVDLASVLERAYISAQTDKKVAF